MLPSVLEDLSLSGRLANDRRLASDNGGLDGACCEKVEGDGGKDTSALLGIESSIVS